LFSAARLEILCFLSAPLKTSPNPDQLSGFEDIGSFLKRLTAHRYKLASLAQTDYLFLESITERKL